MGRKLETEEAMRLGEPEALETAAANNLIDLSEKKKKNKKTNKKDKKREEREGQTKRLDENGDHLIEKIKALNKSELKEAKKKRKHTEIELCSGVVSVSDGKLLKNGEKREKKIKKKDETERESNFHADKVGQESLGERDEIEGVNGVSVSGNGVNDAKYRALSEFDDSGLPDEVLHCCKTFSKPSPIQAHAWPFLLDGRDFIGIAATGSGKTLAFGVPALMHILKKDNKKQSKKAVPRCLVLSPTRELAQQIFDVLRDAGSPCGITSVCLYGGTSKGPQISSLKAGVDIVIGTPGRLKDLIEMGICCLKEVSFVVLDEADRMLDMGFEPEVRSILNQTSSVRQMVMFSATWPLAVHQLSQEFMDPNPVKVVVGSEDLAANHDVMQIVEVLEDRARDSRLVALLEKYHQSHRNRVLVFVLYKKEAVRVENMLQHRGWKAVSVHGDKAQHDRTKALSLFKEGKCPLMIATDVASRGLDIPDVEVVINYSFPLTTEDYVHRIGRTGRAGKKGVAHTFFTKENKALAGELVNVLREAGQIIPSNLTKFGTHVKKKESKLYGAHFKEITADAPKASKITFSNSDDED
ncbi:DEAD-box ATP-dependent RNA helicase 5 [Phalaenopsis equestris]|uniref:DEAD-box ATP-dependent RNA helicase 5 n=1 Tax=Phalaenopsis equestris TaxID=78828 RepID=UPI0009E29E49|nr:DEAD-box ATP-dependent RNA helicase 5 [Phalaenopsis equestris]